ncbi:hypothetical protein MHI57_24320 [Cytobacillus sp. FSL K6-0129]|uniref:hypothetical protein n=1 Tax=unclassified Cytobacillus TaxID=2675268 RepID=UPI0030FB1F59
MARTRNKVYKQGDRINIYLSRDITPEFVEWINKQSDLSNFFLYAAQQLYNQTGFVDVAEVMPRKINFDLSSTNGKQPIYQPEIQKEEQPEKEVITKETTKTIEPREKEESSNSAWSSLDDFDDPFA